jgi:hypothetical protein
MLGSVIAVAYAQARASERVSSKKKPDSFSLSGLFE